MIFNNDTEQILQNITDNIQNPLSQLSLPNLKIYQKQKENQSPIKKLVRGKKTEFSDYKSRTYKTFSNIKKINSNENCMFTYQRKNQQFNKLSVKYLDRSKENLLLNKHTNNYTRKSVTPEQFQEKHQKSQNISLSYSKYIRECLQSKMQFNLTNKLQQYTLENYNQSSIKLSPKQNLQANNLNQICFYNSCINLRHIFDKKSFELKQKFLEQQSQIIEEKIQDVQQKEFSKKILSSSFEQPKRTSQKKKIYLNQNLNGKSYKETNDNELSLKKFICSSNLKPQQSSSIIKNKQRNHTEDNLISLQNDKIDQYILNELKVKYQSEENLQGYIPPQGENQLILSPKRNSQFSQSSKVNRYKKLIQSFKSFHIQQTQLKSEIELKESIQLNDLNHISEFSIFMDEEQNNYQKYQNERLCFEINQQNRFQMSPTNNRYPFQQDSLEEQNNQKVQKIKILNDCITKIDLSQSPKNQIIFQESNFIEDYYNQIPSSKMNKTKIDQQQSALDFINLISSKQSFTFQIFP